MEEVISRRPCRARRRRVLLEVLQLLILGFGEARERERANGETGFLLIDRRNSDALSGSLSMVFSSFPSQSPFPLWNRKPSPSATGDVDQGWNTRCSVASRSPRRSKEGSAHAESAVRGAPRGERRKNKGAEGGGASRKLDGSFSFSFSSCSLSSQALPAYPYLRDALGRHRRKEKKGAEKGEEDKGRRKRKRSCSVFFFIRSSR